MPYMHLSLGPFTSHAHEWCVLVVSCGSDTSQGSVDVSKLSVQVCVCVSLCVCARARIHVRARGCLLSNVVVDVASASAFRDSQMHSGDFAGQSVVSAVAAMWFPGQAYPGQPPAMPPGMPAMPGMPAQPQWPQQMSMPGVPQMMPGMPQMQALIMAATQMAQHGAMPPASSGGGSPMTHTPASTRPSSRSSSRGPRFLDRHDSHPERSDSGSPLKAQKDDKQGVSTSFRRLGLSWHNDNRHTPIAFRISLINACDPRKFTSITLNNLDDEAVDMLLYVVAGVAPNVRPANFNVSSKREVRLAVRDQYRTRMRSQPGRLNQLSEEFDNVGGIAMKLGYKEQWLSPETAHAFNAHRAARAAAVGAMGGVQASRAPRMDSPDAAPSRRSSNSMLQDVLREQRPAAPTPRSSGLRDRRPLERRAPLQPVREEPASAQPMAIVDVPPVPASTVPVRLFKRQGDEAEERPAKLPRRAVDDAVGEALPEQQVEASRPATIQPSGSWSLPALKRKPAPRAASASTPQTETPKPVVDRRSWFRTNSEPPSSGKHHEPGWIEADAAGGGGIGAARAIIYACACVHVCMCVCIRTCMQAFVHA